MKYILKIINLALIIFLFFIYLYSSEYNNNDFYLLDRYICISETDDLMELYFACPRKNNFLEYDYASYYLKTNKLNKINKNGCEYLYKAYLGETNYFIYKASFKLSNIDYGLYKNANLIIEYSDYKYSVEIKELEYIEEAFTNLNYKINNSNGIDLLEIEESITILKINGADILDSKLISVRNYYFDFYIKSFLNKELIISKVVKDEKYDNLISIQGHIIPWQREKIGEEDA